MAAEVVAAQQAQLLGEKVGPELTEFAKQALVQGLYTQRNSLLETQRRAQAVLQDLEDRLSELHLPLQERIQAYEKRITELEKELENRSGEVRELTRATLLLVRQKLEKERERSALRFS
jgi:tetrahydromethanopterin S-methyltransferase subunit G